MSFFFSFFTQFLFFVLLLLHFIILSLSPPLLFLLLFLVINSIIRQFDVFPLVLEYLNCEVYSSISSWLPVFLLFSTLRSWDFWSVSARGRGSKW